MQTFWNSHTQTFSENTLRTVLARHMGITVSDLPADDSRTDLLKLACHFIDKGQLGLDTFIDAHWAGK